MSFQPRIVVVRTAAYNGAGSTPPVPAASPAGSVTVDGIQSGGLDKVKGVSQVMQVAGDDNKATNLVRVQLAKILPSDGTASSETDGTMAAGEGTQSVKVGDVGAVVTTEIAANRLATAVAVPGQGVAQQSLAGLLGMRQSVQVNGNLNRVMNSLHLKAMLRDLGDLGRSNVNIHAALQNLRGLP